MQQPMLDYQLFVAAIAAHDMEALKPLALLLKERSWTDAEDVQGRYALIDYITRFVQGIPTTAISTPRGGAMPPVHTLLHRLGDADSKSLVLAILLHHCGFDTGLFVSLTERHALCAVAVAEGGRGDQGDPSATTEVMRQWREAVDLSAEDDVGRAARAPRWALRPAAVVCARGHHPRSRARPGPARAPGALGVRAPGPDLGSRWASTRKRTPRPRPQSNPTARRLAAMRRRPRARRPRRGRRRAMPAMPGRRCEHARITTHPPLSGRAGRGAAGGPVGVPGDLRPARGPLPEL